MRVHPIFMRRKKLFYVPGLISLIGLPVLLFFLGPEDPVYHTVLKIKLPADKPRNDGYLNFNKVDFLHTIKHKKLISVDINDDDPFDELSRYEFGRHTIHHRFCRRCGLRPFSHKSDQSFYAVNIACLDDVDTAELIAAPVAYVDGLHDDFKNPPKETRHL